MISAKDTTRLNPDETGHGVRGGDGMTSTILFKSRRTRTPANNWRKVVFKSHPMNRDRTMTQEAQRGWASATLSHGGECAKPRFGMPGGDKWSVRMVQYVLNRVDGDAPHSLNILHKKRGLDRARTLAKLAEGGAA